MDISTEELKYYRRTQRIGLSNAEAIYKLLQAVPQNSWMPRIEQESLSPAKPRQEYKDPHRPGKSGEEIDAELEKNEWRARLAEKSLRKQATKANKAGDTALSSALTQRAERAAWVRRECSEKLIGYVIGDPSNSDPRPEAPLRRRDFER